MNNIKLADLITIDQILNWIESNLNNNKFNVVDPNTKQNNYVIGNYVQTDVNLKYPNLDENLPYISRYNGYSNNYNDDKYKILYIDQFGMGIMKYEIDTKCDKKYMDQEYVAYLENNNKTLVSTSLICNLNIQFLDKPDLNISINQIPFIVKQKITHKYSWFKKYKTLHTITGYDFDFVIKHGNYENTIQAKNTDILKYSNTIKLLNNKITQFHEDLNIAEKESNAKLLISRLGF